MGIFIIHSPAGRTPSISFSFSVNPILLSLSRLPLSDSIELIPIAPSISFISCDHPLTRLYNCTDAISGFCLLASLGSLVVIPHAHRPVLHVWHSVQPIAISFYPPRAPSIIMCLKVYTAYSKHSNSCNIGRISAEGYYLYNISAASYAAGGYDRDLVPYAFLPESSVNSSNRYLYRYTDMVPH